MRSSAGGAGDTDDPTLAPAPPSPSPSAAVRGAGRSFASSSSSSLAINSDSSFGLCELLGIGSLLATIAREVSPAVLGPADAVNYNCIDELTNELQCEFDKSASSNYRSCVHYSIIESEEMYRIAPSAMPEPADGEAAAESDAPAGDGGGGGALLEDATEAVATAAAAVAAAAAGRGRPERGTRALQMGHTRLLFRSHGSMHFL